MRDFFQLLVSLLECRKLSQPNYNQSKHRLNKQIDFWQNFLRIFSLEAVAQNEVDENKEFPSDILSEFESSEALQVVVNQEQNFLVMLKILKMDRDLP